MKPPSHRVAIVYLVLVAAILVLIALKITIWSAPGIVVSADDDEIVIDSRFLGEYHLGLERIRISPASGQEVIVDIRDSDGRLPNIFRLGTGVNRIAAADGEPINFVLHPKKHYVLTLCGNNGWGRTRCRSKSVHVPRD